MVGSVTVLNKTCVCVAVGVGLGEGDFRPIASASAPPGRPVRGGSPVGRVVALVRRSSIRAPRHACGVRSGFRAPCASSSRVHKDIHKTFNIFKPYVTPGTVADSFEVYT